MNFSSLFAAVVMAAVAVQTVAADDAANEFFEKKVRPILVARCFECHSAGAKRLEGNLRLDGRALALKGGDTAPAIVPGSPEKSLLVDAINYGETYQMPPTGRLPAEEIKILTEWVKNGAVWPNDTASAVEKKFDLAARRQSHWAWQPIRDLAPPPVKNAAWPLQPLDKFILAKMESQGFAPAAPADKRTLLRRAYFDLIGLPPTPDDLNAFVADDSPQAFEKVVDRLLASPQFGERWGRHWLDLARYAESRGHEFDYDTPNAFQYRDYVIRALNADVPYDQFVIEQIAGDLLPSPRTNPEEGFNESVLGTGFWFLGEWVHSPVDLRKDEADRFDNMVDVFSKTFLGLTVACARCHDHKFDAISQADYYAMFGYLKSSGYRLARFDTEVQHRKIGEELESLDREYLRKLTKVRVQWAQKPASEMAKLLEANDPRVTGGPWKELWEAATKLRTENHPKGELLKLAAKWAAERQEKLEKHQAEMSAVKMIANYTRRDSVSIGDDGNLLPAFLADGPTFGRLEKAVGWLTLGLNGDQARLSIEEIGGVVRDPRWNGLTLAGNSGLDPGGLSKVRAGKTIASPIFTLEKPNVYYLVEGTGVAYAAVASHAVINGPLHGSLVMDMGGKPGEAPLRWVQHSLPTYVGQRFHVELSAKEDEPLRVLMIAQGDRPPPLPLQIGDAEVAGLLAKTERVNVEAWAQVVQDLVLATLKDLERGVSPGNHFSRVDPQRIAVGKFLLTNDFFMPADAPEKKEYDDLVAEYRKKSQELTGRIRRDSRLALAMWDLGGENEHLMIRGNPSPKTLGPEVPRGLLTAIEMGTRRPTVGPSSEWSGRLQLAQRMMETDNPFPARVLVNRVWHHLFGRGIVPSTDNFGVLGLPPTHPELLDFLAREFQLDGWSQKRLIKSIVMSRTYQQASEPAAKEIEERDPENLLWRRTNVRRLEGEVIRDSMLALSGRLDPKLFGPSVPLHLNDFLQGRGRPASGPLDGNGRRSIYISVRRNFLSPMMLAFDTPSPFSTVGRRNVSNVPAQALILMNDPFVIEQAKRWAKATAGESSPDTRIRKLYEQAYGREPTELEITESTDFLKTQATALGLPADKALADERPWNDLCHVLWNVKEFVFVR